MNCKRVAIVNRANENFSIINMIYGNLIGSVFADYLVNKPFQAAGMSADNVRG